MNMDADSEGWGARQPVEGKKIDKKNNINI
jgi:hypothetical protein